MKYRAVLFDFDGTLIPSLPLWIEAFHIALADYGVALSDDEIVQRCFYRDWTLVAAELGLPDGTNLRLSVENGLKQAFRHAQLYPLARPMILHCRENGLQTALVTSAPRSMIEELVPRLALDDVFDFLICGDDVANYKPHPEPVLTTLSALGREPDEAIMIGDSRADILAGKAAGTATALFLPDSHHRFHSVEELHATEPDHVFTDHAKLPALLGLPELTIPDTAIASAAG